MPLMASSESTIRIERPKAFYRDRLRAYVMCVDGKVVGEVRPGGSLQLEVSPGGHTVEAKIDWVTATLDVQVQAGANVAIYVQPGGGALKWWQAFGDKPASYLKLELKDLNGTTS